MVDKSLSSKGLAINTVVEKPFKTMERRGYRWFGTVVVDVKGRRVHLLMTGSISQWFTLGERVRLVLLGELIS